VILEAVGHKTADTKSVPSSRAQSDAGVTHLLFDGTRPKDPRRPHLQRIR